MSYDPFAIGWRIANPSPSLAWGRQSSELSIAVNPASGCGFSANEYEPLQTFALETDKPFDIASVYEAHAFPSIVTDGPLRFTPWMNVGAAEHTTGAARTTHSDRHPNLFTVLFIVGLLNPRMQPEIGRDLITLYRIRGFAIPQNET